MTTQINGFVVLGAIEAKWLVAGAQGGYLGMPTSNETPTFDGLGRFQSFQRGRIAWHPQIGAAFAVTGAISGRWCAIGAEQFGYPITDESTCPDKHGRYNHFRTMQTPNHPEASIYWTPETGAVEVYGGIRQRWVQLGWENGPKNIRLLRKGRRSTALGAIRPFRLARWHGIRRQAHFL
jgi:uncharacterized protein with LGFP repeats